MRGLALEVPTMDFGLDRIIEMIEDRFGRWAGTGLLLIVALGAAAISAHAVVTYLIRPAIVYGQQIWAFFAGGSAQFSKADLWRILVGGFLGGAAGVIGWGLFLILIVMILRRLTRNAGPLLVRLVELENKIDIGMRAYRAAVAAAKEQGIDPAIVERRIDAALADRAPKTPAIPSLPSPPDTGSETPL